MSQIEIGRPIVRIAPFPEQVRTREPLDRRRVLQLVLGGLWLLDGVLQFQPFMYTKAFPAMLAATAAGNPAIVSAPITANANLIGQHTVVLNTLFATVQVLLGVGILFRPTVRAALAASICWAAGVWWLGEGFGGVLSGTASPLNGAPGAVILYALLAVLLWPAEQDGAAPFVAARAVHHHLARLVWLVLWLSLAWFAVTPANRAPQGLASAITTAASGEPRWLASADHAAATLVTGHGLTAALVLAAALAAIGAGIFLPTPAVRPVLVLALVVACVIWAFGEALGGLFTGTATDPNSGPLLVVLAAAYWPSRYQPADRYRAAHARRGLRRE